MPIPSRKDITAIIVTHNSEDTLPACLESLGAIPAIVVDNASADDSLPRARERDFPTEIVALGTNTGFAAGANIGARQAQTPFILRLNPDAQLAKLGLLR